MFLKKIYIETSDKRGLVFFTFINSLNIKKHGECLLLYKPEKLFLDEGLTKMYFFKKKIPADRINLRLKND